MIGLALGVDYSLLIVTRFRSSLAEGHAPKQAASIAANTAGRTATFAGRGAAGHHRGRVPLLSPGTVLLSMALGMGVVTVLSMIGAILVLATTSLLGHRINKWQIGGAPHRRRRRDLPGRRPSPVARRWPPACWRRSCC